MRVILDSGGSIDLGITEVSPTVGITDYSRRVTDDFGVTTVVRRGFSRQMELRFALPFDAVSIVQQRLADIRATPALWVADDRYRALAIRGIYKDFDIDLAMPPLSYCSLTINGLAESDVVPDPGGDPAIADTVSTLRVIQPLTIDDSVLTASSVPENDAPAWSAGATYGDAARVIAGHRVFESLTPGNVGNDPLTSTGKWVELGPTNRWAAFDQALGTVMAAAGPVVVTLASGTADALALLDVTGVAVRVQANGYDRTQAVAPGALTFTDLPGGAVTVTIAGPGTVSVGTLLIGRMVALGVTEASPTAGITDYSRKEVDDFGEVTIVQRAWSKRMQARALIRADAVDMVFDRIAALRAVPALWIGDADSDALTIYGFFKDFSIEIGETTAKLSLSVEGLSRAAKVEPLKVPITWEEVTDPHGTKPENNATAGAPAGTSVGDVRAEQVSGALRAMAGAPTGADLTTGAKAFVARVYGGLVSQYGEQMLGASRNKRTNALLHLDGIPVGVQVRRIEAQQASDMEAVASTLEQLTARVDTTQSSFRSALVTERTARSTALAAETVSRNLAISEAVASEGVVRSAAIAAEATTRADAMAAETADRAVAISTVTTLINREAVKREAAIATEATTRADAVSAETLERKAAISAVTIQIGTETDAREAAISEERTTRATALGAVAKSVTDLGSKVGEQSASVQFLLEAVDGKRAVAQLTTNVNGLITGFRINGQDGVFGVLAERFFVAHGTDAAPVFEIVDGLVTISKARIRDLQAGNLDYGALGTAAEYFDDYMLQVPYTAGDIQTWTKVCALTMQPDSGAPMRGFFSAFVSLVAGSDTPILIRIIRRTPAGVTTGYPWCGPEGVAFPPEGAVHIPFRDSIDAGEVATYEVEIRCPGGNSVRLAMRQMDIEERSRIRFNEIQIHVTQPDTGPGSGAQGGGGINGNFTTTPDPDVRGTFNPNAPRSGYQTRAYNEE